VIVELLTRGNEARDIGLRAREVFDKQAGATARSVEAIREVLGVAADSAVGVEVRPA